MTLRESCNFEERYLALSRFSVRQKAGRGLGTRLAIQQSVTNFTFTFYTLFRLSQGPDVGTRKPSPRLSRKKEVTVPVPVHAPPRPTADDNNTLNDQLSKCWKRIADLETRIHDLTLQATMVRPTVCVTFLRGIRYHTNSVSAVTPYCVHMN